MNLSVYAAARDAPDADAVVLAEGGIWTWSVVARRVEQVAERLLERFGDAPDRVAPDRVAPDRVAPRRVAPHRVAFVAEARPATILTYLALWELGWTAVPLHVRWTDAEQSAYLDRLGGARRLDRHDLSDFESLEPLQEDSILPAVHGAAVAQDEPCEGRIAALIATSGSSGGPKSVALSRRAFLASARASASRLGWRDDDRWLASLPWAHVGGVSVLTRCLEARRALVMTPPSASFDATQTAAWVFRHRVTLLSLVPTMLRRLLDEFVEPPPSLRAVLLGGAAAPPSLVEEALSVGWPLWLTYGLTEACSQVATSPAEDSFAESGLGARLLEGVEARIEGGAEADGNEGAKEGPLEIRGDVLFSGYEPDGPRQSPTDWFRTGDLARLDGSKLYVLGRADDVIVTGGENVHPAEVEAALLEHPRVRSASVMGVDDERWGQVVAATVVADGVDESELDAFLRERLASFRIPRRWRFVEELPAGATGKIDLKAIRRLL